MKTILAFATLVLLASSPLGTATDAQAGGVKRHGAGMHHARAKRRPSIRRSSAREPGGRCGKLNLERARLYGLCR